jgi:hypothetical protein
MSMLIWIEDFDLYYCMTGGLIHNENELTKIKIFSIFHYLPNEPMVYFIFFSEES